ncbi:MAG: hypothetical protein KAH06_09880 [Desulfobacterales bacterium]|nr:hypothetical protein [Desulfobacterales bacterium]
MSYAFSLFAKENKHALLLDLKYNSIDVILFHGDQPLTMKCYHKGGASPRKLFITGEGSNIPGICELFEKRLNLKSEIINWSSPDGKSNIPACVYGMAQDISTDAGGVNLFMQDIIKN